jgi:putative flippase GtrA
MKTLIRWCKFNLVGAMGMVLQLVALACFNRWMHGHYLLATVAAIELTLLHNFAWHWFYTWRDRRSGASPMRALAQFQLTNGMVSLVGNLALMRVLVQQAHPPVVPANVVAIACCSMANFWLGDNWAFAGGQRLKVQPRLNW